MQINGIFKKLKILISGDAGFVGAHVVKLLLEQDNEVTMLDDLSSGWRGAALGKKFILGDIGNLSLLNHLFGNTSFDCVIHLAGMDNGPESLQIPSRYIETNLVKTIGLLDAMVRHDVTKMIFASSAAVYGEPLYTPLDEGRRKAPSNPAGASKWMVEQVLQQYERTYGLTSISLLYFNVVGAYPDPMIDSRRISNMHFEHAVVRPDHAGRKWKAVVCRRIRPRLCNPLGGFGLTCEISYPPWKPLPLDVQRLIDCRIADCRRVGLVRPDDKIIVANQIDTPHAYVVYDHACAANVATVKRWFAQRDIVSAGHYSEWKYCNFDHSFPPGKKQRN